MSLSGVKDTDFLILDKLNDYELGRVCQANKYVKKLCNDDTFWRNRMIKNLERININVELIFKIKEFLEFDRWKDYYVYIFSNTNKTFQNPSNIRSDKDVKELYVQFKPKDYESILGKLEVLKVAPYIDKNALRKYIKRELFPTVLSGNSNVKHITTYNLRYHFRISNQPLEEILLN